MSFVSRGFRGRRPDVDPSRLPPGQYITHDFPVLSAGPTPHRPLAEWSFTVRGRVDAPHSWTWAELHRAPRRGRDRRHPLRHQVDQARHDVGGGRRSTRCSTAVQTDARFATAFCDGGYTTNLPLDDLRGGRAWVAYRYGGEPLDPEHGGPARLLVPHLYFWKSAKWVRGIELMLEDQPGFWEAGGYHDRGDPWREQRYQGD